MSFPRNLKWIHLIENAMYEVRFGWNNPYRFYKFTRITETGYAFVNENGDRLVKGKLLYNNKNNRNKNTVNCVVPIYFEVRKV